MECLKYFYVIFSTIFLWQVTKATIMILLVYVLYDYLFFVSNLLALMKIFIKENIVSNSQESNVPKFFKHLIYIYYYKYTYYLYYSLKDIILAASASPSA